MFKPTLSKLPAAKGRNLIHRGMNTVSSLPGGGAFIEILGHTAPSRKLKTLLAGISVSNPVGLSGRIDPLLSGTAAFGNLGFGFIEVGPVSLQPQNDETVQFNKTDGTIAFSRIGESPGLNATQEKIAKLNRFDKPVFIRIDPTATVQDATEIIHKLRELGDAFIAANTFTNDELRTLKQVAGNKPLFCACTHEEVDVRRIEKLKQAAWIDGVLIEESGTETPLGIEYTAEQAGALGVAVRKMKKACDLPIITAGGIADPRDAVALFRSGADAVMLTSGYVATGPGLPKRINEAVLHDREPETATHEGWQWYWWFGFIMALAGALALLVSMTVVVLPYDEHFLRLTREELMAINPRIYRFMQHDRMTVAGTMISGGVIYMQLARHGVQRGLHWAKLTINVAGITGFLGILLFLGFGYFDWLHGLLWLILLPLFLKGFQASKSLNEQPKSANRINHAAWKRSLYGQLAFVSLGAALAVGGIVISLIGLTGVFVSTDITYICMPAEQMNAINDRLIPVIAHDRAGFGSALFSVGLLVLLLALWGFRQGEKWVWQTFLFGGIPAFSAGISVHYLIGYTTFIHLLPAFIGLALYGIGLWFSKDFFFYNEAVDKERAIDEQGD